MTNERDNNGPENIEKTILHEGVGKEQMKKKYLCIKYIQNIIIFINCWI